MSPPINIVDYNTGHWLSCSDNKKSCGEPIITTSAVDIARAKKLILPGVGSFDAALRELRSRQLFEPLKDFLKIEINFY